MYRVYDLQNKKWVKENIYLSPHPHSDLYLLKKGIFGRCKLKLISNEKYIVHKDIGLIDKNKFLIYEGDYVEAQVSEDRIVIGLIAYIPELASYVILCNDSNEYFTFGTQACDYIQVIGNVFDGYENS